MAKWVKALYLQIERYSFKPHWTLSRTLKHKFFKILPLTTGLEFDYERMQMRRLSTQKLVVGKKWLIKKLTFKILEKIRSERFHSKFQICSVFLFDSEDKLSSCQPHILNNCQQVGYGAFSGLKKLKTLTCC